MSVRLPLQPLNMQNGCNYSTGRAIHLLDLTKSMSSTSLSTNVPSLVHI
jgi:hypothetical protein